MYIRVSIYRTLDDVNKLIPLPGILIGFQPKLVQRCTLISPLCALIKFQLDKSLCLQVMSENAVCKMKEKMKKLFWNFVHFYLKICWKNVLQIWYVDLQHSEASQQQIWLNSDKRSPELHRCENYVLCLPVNILAGWHDGFLGRTTHYCVSWLLNIKMLHNIAVSLQ